MSAQTDDEQIEAIKRFIAQHGSKLLLAIIAVIALYAGYMSWTKGNYAAKETASIYYNELALIASNANKTDEQKARFTTTYNKLTEAYPDTRYAVYGALMKAQAEVENKQLDDAMQTLQWAKTHSVDKNLKALVNLRLARVTAALEKYDDALALLAQDADSYAAQYEQAKGDVLLLQDKKSEALVAYQKAKVLLSQIEGTNTQLLDIKINSLSDANSASSSAASQ